MPGCYLYDGNSGSTPDGQAMSKTPHNPPFLCAFYQSLFVADGQVRFTVQILGDTLLND